jgi:hypothetical protein
VTLKSYLEFADQIPEVCGQGRLLSARALTSLVLRLISCLTPLAMLIFFNGPGNGGDNIVNLIDHPWFLRISAMVSLVKYNCTKTSRSVCAEISQTITVTSNQESPDPELVIYPFKANFAIFPGRYRPPSLDQALQPLSL